MTVTTSALGALTRALPRGYRAREFRDADRERMIEIRNADVHPAQRGSAESWRQWERLMPEPDLFRLVVEAPDGDVAGSANVSTGGPFRSPDGSARGGVQVAAPHRGKGIGTGMLALVEEEARRRAAPRLFSGVSAEHPFALDWATKRGYVEVGRRIQAYVDLTTFDPAAWRERAARPRETGIRFASMEQHVAGKDADAREAALRELYDVETETWADVPIATPMRHWSYEEFRRVALESPQSAPGLSSLALDGDRIVGMSTSYRDDAEKGGTAFTGTRRAHRGRGIAFAMKIEILSLAKGAGIRWMLTTNDEPNKAMRGINYALGYQMLPAHIQLEQKLT